MNGTGGGFAFGTAFGAAEIAKILPEPGVIAPLKVKGTGRATASCIWLSHNGLLAVGEALMALSLGTEPAAHLLTGSGSRISDQSVCSCEACRWMAAWNAATLCPCLSNRGCEDCRCCCRPCCCGLCALTCDTPLGCLYAKLVLALGPTLLTVLGATFAG